MLLWTRTSPVPCPTAASASRFWSAAASTAASRSASSTPPATPAPPSTSRSGSKVQEADRLPLPTLSARQLNEIRSHIITASNPRILNTLLGSLTHSSNPQNALLLYNQMLSRANSHNHYTFTHALKASSLLHSYPKGQEIHASVCKSGHNADVFIQNSLIHFYFAVDEVCSACRVFYLTPFLDVISWTSVISGLFRSGFAGEAISKFSAMDVQPNSTTIVSVISACSSLRALKLGKAVHGYSLRNFNEDNIILDNALLDFYVKLGSLASAWCLFFNMPRRDVVSWTTMISGLAQRGFCEEAIGVFQDMVQRGEEEPNEATIVSALSACSSLSSLSLGQWIHSHVDARRDLVVEGNLGNALINMYVKCSSMDMAVQVFNMIPYKDIISWSTIISGMAMNGHSRHALQLFARMLIHGVPPDSVAFLGLLSACSHGGLIGQGMMFFKAMKEVYNFIPEMQHYACMADIYSRAGLLEEAEALITKMPVEEKGVIWGPLLNACQIHGNEEMLARVGKNLHNTREVSIGTYALLSNTYASADRWEDANKVRDVMKSKGLKKLAGCSWIEVVGLYKNCNKNDVFSKIVPVEEACLAAS